MAESESIGLCTYINILDIRHCGDDVTIAIFICTVYTQYVYSIYVYILYVRWVHYVCVRACVGYCWGYTVEDHAALSGVFLWPGNLNCLVAPYRRYLIWPGPRRGPLQLWCETTMSQSCYCDKTHKELLSSSSSCHVTRPPQCGSSVLKFRLR